MIAIPLLAVAALHSIRERQTTEATQRPAAVPPQPGRSPAAARPQSRRSPTAVPPQSSRR
jgi:hypothetical protein